ncbi:uncharacterized protein [Rutidosis leptorrhynchoides]|uniref:uncharacterized protein n=1 Tax=Rutidosis leptorrhynchoides TaxID=125765 RepID=UPI003A9A0CDC
MDDTVSIEPVDRSEVRSDNLSEKRPLENGFDNELGHKKARTDVKLVTDVKKVAEIVLVLATMGKMRGGRKPSAVEVEMMCEARAKLVDVCKEFAPKDIFPREVFGSVIEDLGLNRLREQKLGIQTPKLSISEKLQLTKHKMEKSEVFPLHSNVYTPPRLQSSVSGPTESRGTVRIFPSDKTNHAPVSSNQANSRTLPYQLPTSEIRPGVHGRDSSSSVPRAERPHVKVDGGANGSYGGANATSAGAHMTGKTPTWSRQPQSAFFNKAGSDKVPAHSSITTQATPGIMNANQHRMNTVQAPSTSDTHSEVSKIVQNLLHPHVVDHPTWSPPSRDYMNKALTCQMCRATITEVDNVLVCDACERGYHLRCLQCNPKSIPRGEWQEWHCAKCLAISNGKPLPPKYGRVMRNISTQKLSSNSVTVQPSLDKKQQSSDVNVNPQIVSKSENSVSQNDSKKTEVQANENREACVSSIINKSNEEKFASLSETQPGNNNSDNGEKVNSNNSLSSNVAEVSHSGKSLEFGANGDDTVKASELCSVASEHETPSSSSMHEVEWVGGVLKEIEGKTYYQSCCINGTVYKLEDYALFTFPGNKHLPNKLQAMWEDGKTKKKWVSVTRCYFPDDLPDGVGRPCAPENNEVYESNHESILEAGLVHGPCEVLPPSKFSEESAVQTRLRARGSTRPKQLFLCKWFYDETKRLFRDVTC